MDWDKLRIFQAVAAAGSFTHAGDKLGLSQSAVSRQISSLEDSLGVSLFHRHARGLILTEQGDILYKTAQDIFAQLATIESKLIDSKQKAAGPLLITVAEFLGTTWLAPMLPNFMDDHPDIQLTILHDDKVLNLGMREADAAIRLFRPEQVDLVQKSIFTMRFYMCASQTYLKKYGKPKTLADLGDHFMLGFPPNTPSPYADCNWHFTRAGLSVDQHDKRIMINSVTGLAEAAANGLGIAALPEYIIKQRDLVALMPESSWHEVTAYFVYPHEHRHSRRIALFRDYLMEHAGK